MSVTGNKQSSGFTLLEMLAVLALVGILASVIGARVSGSLQGAQERKALNALVATLRDAHVRALSSGQAHWVNIDLQQRTFSTDNGKRYRWPHNVKLILTTAQGLGSRYVFSPDGAASGGNIVVAGPVHRWRLDISWLTSAVVTTQLP